MHLALVVAGAAVWTALAAYLVPVNLYFFGVSLLGLRRGRSTQPADADPSFAVVVPARNEEQTVARTVASALAADYPDELVEVVVVADNCDDATVERARAAGATVLVREDSFHEGRNEAVRVGIEYALAGDCEADAVLVLAAGSVVSPSILRELARRLRDGHKVLQAQIDRERPIGPAGWTAPVASAVFGLASGRAGLPCRLRETGLCIDADTLRRFGWESTTLTDELEHTARLVLVGILPTWAPESVVKAASTRRRESLRRTLQGHWDASDRYARPLLLKAWRDRSLPALHGALLCVTPRASALLGAGVLFGWASLLAAPVIGLPGRVLLGVAGFLLLAPLVQLTLGRASWRLHAKYVLLVVAGPVLLLAAAFSAARRSQTPPRPVTPLAAADESRASGAEAA